ncbi:MAG: T9SS type A sorting domain-containing protein [FCB group bacterium]|nr:T9SS type A sorting domain-containing protein [FCB group bacterium]
MRFAFLSLLIIVSLLQPSSIISAVEITFSEPFLIETDIDSTCNYTYPTLLTDSAGVLLYNQLSTDTSTQIIGYRFNVEGSQPVIESRGNVIQLDTALCAPWFYDLGDRKALFYHEYTDKYRGRMIFFNGDFPLQEDVDNRIHLYSANQVHPPAALRIDSLLYLTQFYNWSHGAEEVFLSSANVLINLTNYSFLPPDDYVFLSSTAGRTALTPCNDTAVVSEYWQFCNDHAPASCREYFCGYFGVFWQDTTYLRFSFNEQTGSCNSGFDHHNDWYSDIFSVKVGEEYVIWRENSFDLMQANTVDRTFDRVVDLQAAAGIDFGYSTSHPFTINPVKIDDGYAVFMINNLHPWESYLLVFDGHWKIEGHAIIPLADSAHEFSQFAYCPQDEQIYFAYSASLSDSYSTSRVFLQSVAINNVTDVEDVNGPLPGQFSLEQNSPNPFNPLTKIEFYLPRQSKVELSIYNIQGQKVATLINRSLPVGDHEIIWNGTDDAGKPVASGVYFYKIISGDLSQARKMILLK